MKVVSITEAQRISVENLRLEGDICDLETPETIAASIRRAASFYCPCPSSQLIQAVFQAQRFLVNDSEGFRVAIAEVLESIIAYGDLIEQSDAISNVPDSRGRVLYLRQPSFVWRDGGSALLLGIAPDDIRILPIEIERRIDHCKHIRRINQTGGESLRDDLKRFGLNEIPVDVWNRKNSIPKAESPEAYINKVKTYLRTNPGTLEGLEVLNPQKDVRNYRRRWEPFKRQTGFFVCRRPQLYGNNLWCFVELQDGEPIKSVDFPVVDRFSLGRDEAWRVQMAIDASQNNRQVFATEALSGSMSRIKFYSPIPTWARRRLDNLGEPVVKADCLFSYKLPTVDLSEEIKFFEANLWLTLTP